MKPIKSSISSISQAPRTPRGKFRFQSVIEAGPQAKSIYGFSAAPFNAWCNYGYALLLIAGAKGKVLEAEWEWLMNHFQMYLELPSKIIDSLKAFDLKSRNLKEVIPEITTDAQLNLSRAILYDSIRMAKETHEYSYNEKREIRNFASLMDLDEGVVHSLEVLVNIEFSIKDARIALLNATKTIESPREVPSSFINLNPVAKELYGLEKLPLETMVAHRRSLLSILGANGTLTEQEYEWVMKRNLWSQKYPKSTIDLEKEIIKACTFNEINLVEELKKITTPINTGRWLVYDSIKILGTEDEYAFTKRLMLYKAVQLLEIDVSVVNAVESIVEMEKASEKMRQSLFQVTRI